jgi:(2Fe-2S) ferredoxin
VRDDWRIRIDLPAESRLFDIPLDLRDEAAELASELKGRRLAVSRDGDTVFVYASSRLEAEQARRVVEAVLRDERVEARTSEVEQWLADEDRWSDEPGEPDVEEETLDEGYAPWEVRVDCRSHREARELADRLEADGYSVARRWRYVIAGAASREDAAALAQRVHGEVEPGGELVYEVNPTNPFAIFGGMGR